MTPRKRTLLLPLLALGLALLGQSRALAGRPGDSARSAPPGVDAPPAQEGLTLLPPPNLRFEHITREDGLTSSVVRCMVQDQQGFIWIGTQDGLNRYDGYDFTIYRYDPQNPFSLRDDFIESIYEDRSGVLWVGTQSGWLERYDRENDRFTHYEISSNVYAIFEDRRGQFWLGTSDPGLLRFDRDTGRTEIVQRGLDFTAIIEDKTGVLWVASPLEGLGRYDRAREQFTMFIPRYPAHAILEDRAGTLWLATWGGGLARFDQQNEEFTYLRPNPGDPNSINSDYVSAIYEDLAGILWVGFSDSGLDRFEPDTGAVAHYQRAPSDPHSLSTNTITAILKDRSGVLWVGHEFGGGLSKVANGVERFGHYQNVPGDPSGLSGDWVTSIFEDHDGILWLGTFAGLDRWDRTTGQWSSYAHDADDPGSLADNAVRSVYVDRSNVLWVGTEGGLDRYDRLKDQFVHVASPVVMWMHDSPSGTFWLATKSGLYTLDRDTEKLTLLRQGYAWKIMVYEDQAGEVWVGTSGDGLERYDPASGSWRRYVHDPDDPRGLSNNSVETIHEDRDGVLWIGTRTGLNRFDRDTETFTQYWVQDGMPHNAVVGILEDEAGYLWLATGGGLSRFNSSDETFRNYDARDGLQSDNFWRNAYHQGHDGVLFFGGENGLNAFRPQQITDNPHVPPVVISAFSLFNQVVRTNLRPGEQIELTYGENFVSFDFAALDYNAPEKNRYAYMLEGLDESWIEAGTRRHADYPNLQPGEYVFRVKGSNNDGGWNEEGTSMRLTIKPPFWGTRWFRILAGLLLVGMAFGAYRLRLRSVEMRSRELERQVEQRTTELSRTNVLLQEQIEERQRAEGALAQERAEAAVLEERNRLARELHDSVTQALYGVTLYAEAAKRMMSTGQVGEAEQHVRDLGETAQEALAEMRLLIFELRPLKLEQQGLVPVLQSRLEAVEGRAGLQTEFNTEGMTRLPPEIEEGLFRIAQEALNNVLKHARATKVSVSLRQSAETVVLEIRDDGVGFDPAEAQEAGGLGLKGIAERTELLGGSVTIDSAHGDGTRLRVEVPR